MKTLATTLCIVGTAFALTACAQQGVSSYDSGSNYATSRTAGKVDQAGKAVMQAVDTTTTERVFRQVQSK